MTKAQSVDLDRFVPALLTFLANRVTSTASATFRNAFGIGVMEFRILVMLASEPNIKASRIVEVIGADKGLVSRTLKTMLVSGLVVADVPSGQPRFTLSELGQATHDGAVLLSFERERRLLAKFDAADREKLISMLKIMLDQTKELRSLATEHAPASLLAEESG